MLQPFITNGIIAILKIKSALCGETPCKNNCVLLYTGLHNTIMTFSELKFI